MWKCKCGELIEDTFDACWKCSEERPEDEVPSAIPAESNATPLECTGRRKIDGAKVREQWATLVDRGAGHAEELIYDIQNRLEEAEIPGECTWSLIAARSPVVFSKLSRPFLSVELKQFKDFHQYIGARDYGIHLDCCWFLTIEPGMLKYVISTTITDDSEALSQPKDILVAQDLRAWITVVHCAVMDAVDALAERIGSDKSRIQRGTKGVLGIW